MAKKTPTGKPFSEYKAEDWREYNQFAAGRLRTDADQAEQSGHQPRKVTDRWRSIAAEFEKAGDWPGDRWIGDADK